MKAEILNNKKYRIWDSNGKDVPPSGLFKILKNKKWLMYWAGYWYTWLWRRPLKNRKSVRQHLLN